MARKVTKNPVNIDSRDDPGASTGRSGQVFGPGAQFIPVTPVAPSRLRYSLLLGSGILAGTSTRALSRYTPPAEAFGRREQ
ncbi:hypothetical protein SBA4_1750022 [Candidatus Sulfopaludibacter sp. SbA4]|nr:hypothetical protein SBA4_1750022 [Candidatus Sulfopaludibacter sp. SbA4]